MCFFCSYLKKFCCLKKFKTKKVKKTYNNVIKYYTFGSIHSKQMLTYISFFVIFIGCYIFYRSFAIINFLNKNELIFIDQKAYDDIYKTMTLKDLK